MLEIVAIYLDGCWRQLTFWIRARIGIRISDFGISALVMLLLVGIVPGCGWQSENTNSSQAESDPTLGDAATVDTGTDVVADDEDTPQVTMLYPSAAASSERPTSLPEDPFFILGEQLPEWDLEGWANEQPHSADGPLTLEQLRGRVVVVRFWTDGSPANTRSMQALEQLAQEFHNEPVQFVGIFYTPLTFGDHWGRAQQQAGEWGVSFPIAEDRRTLNRWWLSRYDNLPKTPTFVIGPDGEVRHLHPGPEFGPSNEPAEQFCDNDFRALRAAIVKALGSQLAETRADG